MLNARASSKQTSVQLEGRNGPNNGGSVHRPRKAPGLVGALLCNLVNAFPLALSNTCTFRFPIIISMTENINYVHWLIAVSSQHL